MSVTRTLSHWHSQVRAAVGDGLSREDDGLFWMAVEDFTEVFATVDMCRLPSGEAHVRTPNAMLKAQKLEEAAATLAKEAGGGGDDWLPSMPSKGKSHEQKKHGRKKKGKPH